MKRWTPEDDNDVIRLWGTMRVQEIARVMGRTEKSIRRRANETLGLKLPPGSVARMRSGARTKPSRLNKAWSPEEMRILRDSWGEFSLSTIAGRLCRTLSAVENKAAAMGLGGHRHGLVRRGTIAKMTGYEYETIDTAISVLGLTLKRLPATFARQEKGRISHRRTAQMGIDEDDMSQLLEYLKRKPVGVIVPRPGLKKGPLGMWGVAMRGPKCVGGCDSNERPHFAKGQCKRCYTRNVKRDTKCVTNNEMRHER